MMKIKENGIMFNAGKLLGALTVIGLLLGCASFSVAANTLGNPESNKPAEKEKTPDPITLVNGGVLSGGIDIVLPCPGLDLTFQRSYNSVSDMKGVLGHKWAHSYEWSVTNWTGAMGGVNASWVQFHAESNPFAGIYGGSIIFFKVESNGKYTPYQESGYKLSKAGDGNYEIQAANGFVYRFNTNGTLAAISQASGPAITLSYSSNRLARAQHSNGQYLSFGYYSNGLLRAVNTPSTNLSVEFSYSANNDLAEVVRHTARADVRESFHYENLGDYGMRYLTGHVNKNGDVFHYSYSFFGGSAETPIPRQGATKMVGKWLDGRNARCTGMCVAPDYYKTRIIYTPPMGIYERSTKLPKIMASAAK